MSTAGRAVRIVLDASAILAFTRNSIHVGETLAEVDDGGAVAGLPILCLAEASWAVEDLERLYLLVDHPATSVLVPARVDWQGLAATLEVTGRLDAASAVLAAIDADCDVLTAQPGLYGGLAGGGPVIVI